MNVSLAMKASEMVMRGAGEGLPRVVQLKSFVGCFEYVAEGFEDSI